MTENELPSLGDEVENKSEGMNFQHCDGKELNALLFPVLKYNIDQFIIDDHSWEITYYTVLQGFNGVWNKIK